jgi:hypothetical protein
MSANEVTNPSQQCALARKLHTLHSKIDAWIAVMLSRFASVEGHRLVVYAIIFMMAFTRVAVGVA